ncbi:hypothetical protein [Microbulbifer sp. JTAC008]|uniref:hypothetical protein n=1 Tax=unclassified Microbulbifer TaxID=2619833 RepID=UPI004039B59E
MYQYYKDYFEGTEDKDAHFFEIAASPYESMFYSESKVFGTGSHKIHIVDQFCGKRPALFNHDFCTSDNELKLKFWCSITLDSNVVSLLHQYVTNRESMKDGQRVATHSFLAHLSEVNCDYSPIFYVMESFFKSDESEFYENVPKALASILKLHSMCESTFVSKGLISVKDKETKHYFDLYEASDYEGCGLNWAKKIVKNIKDTDIEYKIKLIYSCLLKMVLIKFEDNKGVYKKSEAFENFMINDLGVRLARESSLAIYYFCNLAGKFINTQTNMAAEDAKHDLKATAWDLYLLKLPEQLLTPNHLPELNTAYVATSEVKLYEIGKLFDIQHLACRTDDDGTGMPVLSFDMVDIGEKVGDKAVTKLLKRNEEISFQRMSREPIKNINPFKLDNLIDDLERQLSYLCT